MGWSYTGRCRKALTGVDGGITVRYADLVDEFELIPCDKCPRMHVNGVHRTYSAGAGSRHYIGRGPEWLPLPGTYAEELAKLIEVES